MSSPQVKTIEYDLSQRVPSYPGMYGLVIGAFDKGKINQRTFISNSQQVDEVFGKPKVGSDIAYFILHTFLSKSKRCWVERVADGALYGGCSIGAAFDVVLGIGDGVTDTFSTTLEYGRCHPNSVEVYLDKIKVGYDNGIGAIIGDTIATGAVQYENGNVTIQFTTPPPRNSVLYAKWGFNNVPFTSGQVDTDSYEFDERQLSQTIIGSSGNYSDTLVPFPLVAPENPVTGINDSTILIMDGTIVIAYLDENGDLIDTGSYLDVTGTNRIEYGDGSLSITLDAAYVPTNQLIAEYRSYKSEIFRIYADSPGSWADNYSVMIDDVDFAENTFRVIVYEFNDRGTSTRIVDYTLSREHKTDGFNRQLYIEDRVNDNNNYIRIQDNPNMNATEVIPQDSFNQTNFRSKTFVTLSNGDSGTAPSVSSYINVLNTYNNKEDVKIDIVIDTLGDRNYQVAIAQLCDRDFGGRGDCYGVLYTPFELEESSNYATDLVNYRLYDLNISSSFVGLYSGHVKLYDAYNGREIWVPNSGFVAAAFSYTADQYEPWFPAAGWRRGMLPVLDVYRKFTLGERDLLYDNDVNVMRFRPGKGIAIWGQKTMHGRPSALDRANVRWLLIVAENAIEEYLEEYEFEINDFITRSLAASGVTSYLSSIKARRGLYDFDVICDESNNTPERIDNYEMLLDYYVQPTKAAEYIKGRAVITRTGVSFDEVRIS